MKRKNTWMVLSFIIIMVIFFPKTSAGAAEVPVFVETPVISDLRLLTTMNGIPYFCLKIAIPESVVQLEAQRPGHGKVKLEFSGKVDAMDWGSSGGGGGDLAVFQSSAVPGEENAYYLYFELEGLGEMTEAAVNSRNYTYRVRFCYSYDNGGTAAQVYSLWSNELSNNESGYLGAKSWAKSELDEAYLLGFITDRIKGNLSGDITREEFAEIAVLFVEAATGLKAQTGDQTFLDTQNPEVNKAAHLGLIQGMGNELFCPDGLLTREQMAAILYRALGALGAASVAEKPEPPVFADDASIDAYAKQAVYHCVQVQIINGIGDNLFAPDRGATRQEAVIVCLRAYRTLTEN